MRINSKKAIRIGVIALSVILVLVVSLILLRKPLLRKALNQVAEKIHTRTGMVLEVEDADLISSNTVLIKGIVLRREADTVFKADRLQTSVSTWPLLTGNIRPTDFSLNNAHLYYKAAPYKPGKADTLRADSSAVAEAGNSEEKADSIPTSQTVEKLLSLNYKKHIARGMDILFRYSPENIRIDSLILHLNDKAKGGTLIMKDLVKQGAPYKMELELLDADSIQTYQVDGKLDDGEKLLSFNVERTSGSVSVPFIEKIFGLKASLQNFTASLKQEDLSSDEVVLKGNTKMQGFTMFHPDISTEEIRLNDIEGSFNLTAGNQLLVLDSTSWFRINKIKVPVYFSYGRFGRRTFTLTSQQTTWNASDFFASLPPGLFNTFEGLEATGDITYSLMVMVDPEKPQDMVFDSNMKSDNLDIQKFGKVDYRKINGPFTHKTYVRGNHDRTFLVSPSTSRYVPIEQVSPYLLNSILTAEDGSFYSHNGFNEKAFRESFVTNLQDSNFTRGGSTITMQLVKNVYLSKRKTIGRKIEEALIVWLIENERLVSKKHLLETYLNIIEWGPHIYGIGEATRFYFDKHPSELTLAESLFLTSIIPKPRKVRYSFDSSSGQLRDYHQGYFNLLTGIMLRRGQITQEDTAGLRPEIFLSENAYSTLNLPQPEKPEEEKEQGLLDRLFGKKKNLSTTGF